MEHFSKFGDISEVHLVLDKDTRSCRGMAFVLYLIPESAKMYLNSYQLRSSKCMLFNK